MCAEQSVPNASLPHLPPSPISLPPPPTFPPVPPPLSLHPPTLCMSRILDLSFVSSFFMKIFFFKLFIRFWKK